MRSDSQAFLVFLIPALGMILGWVICLGEKSQAYQFVVKILL